MTTPPVAEGGPVERLADPEQLDRLLDVTTRPAWAALGAVWLLLGFIGIWSVAGRVPITVEGSGLLISAAGLREVATLGAGVVEAITVRVGDTVDSGTVVARIRQPLLEQQFEQARERVRSARLERDARASLIARGSAVEIGRLDAARADIERRSGALAERVRFLEGRVAAEREARTQGLVTETSVQASVAALEAARSERAGLTLDLQQNALRRIQAASEDGERMSEVERRLQEAERDLAAARLSLEQASLVTSPQRGIVREIRSNAGQLVAAGQSLLSVEPEGAPLQGVVFVSRDAKRIGGGMRVRVSPAAVAQEEYGYILGRVRSVSTQPATLAGMARTLGNDLLVQQLAVQGASFLVEVDLERDPTTATGFRWSSRTGPPRDAGALVGSGSVIRVAVEVQRRRPIELLLPFLRRMVGIAA
jgi:HlyD family secretion protein